MKILAGLSFVLFLISLFLFWDARDLRRSVTSRLDEHDHDIATLIKHDVNKCRNDQRYYWTMKRVKQDIEKIKADLK
jgi:predicted PurR-regulated permease PerM